VLAVPQQMHIIPAAGTDHGTDDTDDGSAGIPVAATVAAAAVWGIGALRRCSGASSSSTSDTDAATDNIAIDERTIRAAMAKQREHNKATDATIAELRAEVAALNSKLNACFIVMIVLLAVVVAAISSRTK
jgi:hypothetical protein